MDNAANGLKKRTYLDAVEEQIDIKIKDAQDLLSRMTAMRNRFNQPDPTPIDPNVPDLPIGIASRILRKIEILQGVISASGAIMDQLDEIV